MSFSSAVAVVLEHEGGYVDDPVDPGGRTKWGISQRSYPDLDIASLTVEDAIAIYRRDWWDLHRYGDLPEVVGAKLLDLSVNMGADRAHRLLQQALAAVGSPVEVDGKLGPITRGAVHRAPPFALLAALRSEAAGFYRGLVAAKPVRGRWIRGWLRRAYS